MHMLLMETLQIAAGAMVTAAKHIGTNLTGANIEALKDGTDLFPLQQLILLKSGT